MIIANVDLLTNSSNHEVMFPEYSRNIPRISVSKLFQGYPRHIVNIFRSQKVQKIVLWVILWKFCFSELYWAVSHLEQCFEKVRINPWQLVKISKEHNIIIIIINLFRQVFNVSVSSTQRQIFVIARVFDIMQFDMLQKFFNCSHCGSTSLPTRIIEPSTHLAFTCSKLTIETLQQGVKPVQS